MQKEGREQERKAPFQVKKVPEVLMCIMVLTNIFMNTTFTNVIKAFAKLKNKKLWMWLYCPRIYLQRAEMLMIISAEHQNSNP